MSLRGFRRKNGMGGNSSRRRGVEEKREVVQVPEEGNGEAGGKENEGAFSVAFGQDGESGGGKKEKEDVKRMTGFDKAELQEKRRREALESQRQRRDEILDKIRELEEYAFSDSDTEEEMDFAALVTIRHQTFGEIFEEEGALEALEKEELELEATTPVLEIKHDSKSKKPRRRRNRHGKGGEGSATDKMDVVSPAPDPDQHQKEAASVHPPRNYNRRPRHRPGPCKAMMSEWLLKKPEDFEENWMGILCPEGMRVIVMASRGKTKIFFKGDEYLGEYKSLLPGGSPYNYRNTTTNRNRGVTILDCIWSEVSETFYVLDLICWNSHSCVNCDTDYRQFFLTSKFAENLELFERSQANPFPYQPLPCFPASELSLVLWSSAAFPEFIDGICFFHKEGFYVSDVNPLCLWIQLTQVEPILETSVSPELLSKQKKVKNLNGRKKQQMKKQRECQESQEMEVANLG